MFCNICKDINICKKVCKEVEKYLRDNGIRKQGWIRPQMPRSERNRLKRLGYNSIPYYREIPFSSLEYTEGLQ